MMYNELNEQFQQIDELLRGARKILIASHENPDADAVSSVLSLQLFFRKQNLEIYSYLPDYPPKNLSFLPGFFDIKTEIKSFLPDAIFCLDYGDFQRLQLPPHILNHNNLNIITIDHHVESDQRGKIKILKPEFSSVAEIIYHWLKYEEAEIDKDMATCLLTGIIADSGGFRHVSTSDKTLNIVSELLLKGVSLNKITRQTLVSPKSYHLSKAWGQILSQVQLDIKSNLAYSWLTFENLQVFGAKMTDFDGIANFIAAASPENLGLFLIEYQKGRIKGSLRSEPYPGRDVIKIAKALGGGGHPYAAGFQQEGTAEEVLKKVLNIVANATL